MAYRNILATRYWNSNNVPVAIVAIEGGNNDVAVYIGGDPNPNASEEATYQHVAECGAKLSREEAYRFLPKLKRLSLAYRD